MTTSRSLSRLAMLVAIAIAIATGWYLISPLFINRSVDEPFPTDASTVMSSSEEGEGSDDQDKMNSAMEKAMAEPDKEMDEPMPDKEMATAAILAQGQFYDIAHHGMGTATIYDLAGGRRVLRFENFRVLNGPELHVYLVPIDPVPNTVGVEIEGSIDIELLKGNVGNQNYELPADLELSAYKSVVIWCRPFRVPFNAAPLTGS